MKKIYVYIALILMCINLISCDGKPSKPAAEFAYDVWVLNEGLWNMNNSSITGYHTISKSHTTDFFSEENGRVLGDVGNDMMVYGAKVYVAVNQSSVLEVVNVYSGKSIKQISLINEKGKGRQPRCITSYRKYVYVCCFDGYVLQFDTSSLHLVSVLKAGDNPDGICVANDKLYVSNSGGLNYPDYGNTVSVFDLASGKEIKKITVHTNPGKLMSDAYGRVFLMSLGNYEDIPSRLQRINTLSDTVEETYDFSVSNFDIYRTTLYFYHYDFQSGKTVFKQMDTQSGQISVAAFPSSNQKLQTPYCLSVNPYTGDVYIGDALDYQSNGDMYAFTPKGELKYNFETGICPKKVVFLE
jgi:hypothetical protein